MSYDLRHNEGQELLRKLRVELRFNGQLAQPRNLLRLSVVVRSGQPVRRLEHPDLLGDLEQLRQRCTSAASMLSMLSRSRISSGITSSVTGSA